MRTVLKLTVAEKDPTSLIEFLELKTSLSKSLLKKILVNGGVWVRKFSKQKLVRVRRATTELPVKAYVEFYYDPELTALEIPRAEILFDQKEWGLWYKPPGLLSQGNEFGDHCTILRVVAKEKNLSHAYIVHRLDREAHGVMLMAYTDRAARLFSDLWQKGEVRKFYRVIVRGILSDKYPDKKGEINLKLDGKEASTTFEIVSVDEEMNTTECLVQIHTGRLHQIRRHFESIDYPVMGDPKYGKNNKNTEGMKLLACRLEFVDPFTQKQMNYILQSKGI